MTGYVMHKNYNSCLHILDMQKGGRHQFSLRKQILVFILDLGPSYTDKLLEFRWVQIAHLS